MRDRSAALDSLPGADRIAKATGATIIANGEAISVMRASGVPEAQLCAIAGGERIPLFTKAQREEAISMAAKGTPLFPRPGPPTPDPATAPITVNAWPSLHCFLPPGDLHSIPDVVDTGTVYTGGPSHASTMDTTRLMTYGLGGMLKSPPEALAAAPPGVQAFVEYMRDTDAHKYSYFDGGQLLYHFLLPKRPSQGGLDRSIVWSGHLGGYEGILRNITPAPDLALLAVAGRANLNGRPFDGSGAQFMKQQLKWLGEPAKVVWCMHDDSCIKPLSTDTRAADEMVAKETKCELWTLEPGKRYELFGS